MEKKYRIEQHSKVIKRNKTNEYIREYLNNHQCLFLQGLSGSGKTYVMFSFIQEFYNTRYIYFKLDQTDNQLEHFKQHLNDAFTYASLDIHHLSLDKPYLLVFDQFEEITNTEVLEYIKYYIQYIPSSLYLIIVSQQALPQIFYKLIYYHQLTIIDTCPLFFNKNEIIKLHKVLHPKKIDPYTIFSKTRGWPLIVSYLFHHDYEIKDDDYFLKHFFDHINLTESQLYLLKIIGLAPYITIDLLKSLSIEHIIEDLSYLLNVSIINEKQGILTMIPIYKSYIKEKYQSSFIEILHLVYPYYYQHHYLSDLLYCYGYIKQDLLQDFIHCNDLSLGEISNDLILDDYDDIHTLYLKGIMAFRNSRYDQYYHIVHKLMTYEQTNDVQTRIINLIYLSNHYDFDMIMNMKSKDIEIHSMIGQYSSFINGKRDLTPVLVNMYKNRNQYIEYRSLFSRREQLSIQLGEIEYSFYINQTRKCLEEIEYFLKYNKEELSSDILAVLSSLLFKIYYSLGLKETALSFYNVYRNKISLNRNDILLNEHMKLHDIYVYCLLNEKEKAYDWYREEKKDEEVRHDNYYHMYILARIHYMMERYDQANYYFTKLEGFFRQEKRPLYLTECLFANGACLLALNNTERALHRVTEAFTVAGSYRYVFPFVTYGKYGLELMKMYRKLMKDDGESKKTYEHNVLTKSYDQYLKSIIKECEKMIKLYPVYKKAKDEQLTVKETAVLKCIIKGYTNKEISEELVVSIPTVKTHISNIFSKLGVKNRTQAIHYVKENHLFENND